MKCISLTQPWATLLCLGFKTIETRSWKTSYRGRLAIHAAKRFSGKCEDLCLIEPFKSCLEKAGYANHTLPTGVLVGSVEVVDCLPVDKLTPSKLDEAFGDFRKDVGRYGWLCINPHHLAVPIPYKGRLGLFELTEEVAKHVGCYPALA